MNENTSEKQTKYTLTLKYPGLIFAVALIILVAFDQMSWNKQSGLQILLTTLLMLTGLFILAVLAKTRAPWASYLLLIPILFGAIMTVLRIKDQTRAINLLLVNISLFLLVITFLNGQWLGYRVREVFMSGIFLLQSLFVDPALLLIEMIKTSTIRQKKGVGVKRQFPPILLGLMIAIPILIVFTALLASADLIFKTHLVNLFNWITIENFVELAFRTFYIIVLAHFLSGAYIHALTRSADKKQLSPDQPLVTPFLGSIESFIVLGSVNLLFLGFIIIQFRYFFAGEANISFDGFTYAEYARRGFFELIAVAIISLGLYYLLSSITKRTKKITRVIFSILGFVLVLQVGLMLISAFQRLSLYEAAYGFTTQRTTTHIFMIWLAVLLAAAVLMEFFNRFRRLALVLFLVFFGFTITINLINMDRFIAARNIEHAIAGNPLDVEYLVWQLSDDGTPALFEYWQNPNTPHAIKDALYATLACKYSKRGENEYYNRDTWIEWHAADARAVRLYEQHKDALQAYPFVIDFSDEFFPGPREEQIMTNIKNYSIIVDDQKIWCKADYPQAP